MIRRPLLVLLATLPLAGCISFGTKPPASLLSISSAASVPPGQTQSTATSRPISVLVPTVPQALAGLRVPVQASETSIAYVADAQWVEPPSRMFARLLSDTVAARTGRIVLSSAQSFSDPGAVLSGELRSFGVDAASRTAVVAFDAALVRTSGRVVEKRRFEARVPIAAVEAGAVGAGLNRAANEVAGEVADWVGK